MKNAIKYIKWNCYNLLFILMLCNVKIFHFILEFSTIIILIISQSLKRNFCLSYIIKVKRQNSFDYC
jgi:hypothetical protein